jgi:OmcA/MtrC family decaheme c-type cytochrome
LGAASALVLALAGCGGGGGGTTAATSGTGATGGTSTSATVTGPSGAPVDASSLSSSDFAALAPSGAITSVSINSPPVVTFQVTDANGRGVKGLGFTSQTSTQPRPMLANLAFSLAKLVPGTNGAPSKWVSYEVIGAPSTTAAGTPTRPTTENYGTLVDNGDGTYKYTFYNDVTKVKDIVAATTAPSGSNLADLGDLTYDPTLLHRLVIQVSGIARGTGTNTANGADSGVTAVPMQNPINIVFDWYPATGKVVQAADSGQREIVKVSACFECHQKFTGFHATAPAAGITTQNAGARQDTRMCVVCHTDQRRYGRTEATASGSALSGNTYVLDGRSLGDFPNFIHKIHFGSELTKTGYNFAGVLFNETKYPQDIRNCTKCHNGTTGATNATAQGDNWKNVPSRLACGACHDGINFATGKGLTLADAAKGLTSSTFGHVGGIQTDDSKCALCHSAAAIPVYHIAATPPASDNVLAGGTNANTNAGWVAGNYNNLPDGAIKVTYDISSVSRNASKQPVIVFRMLQNGTPTAFNDKSTKTEIWDNFIGSPSAYFVFAVPQDGITAPADFNASVSGYIKTIWNGTATGSGAGTLSAPDSSGYYTLTLTGVTIPDSAVMLTGGLGYTYALPGTQPLTQINLADYAYNSSNKTGGLVPAIPNVTKVATGYTGRRAIVDNALCNKCHEKLGPFTAEAFHAGQRNDGPTCSWCHNPNRTSSGWSADSEYYIHAIHGASKRAKKFTWHAATTTESFADVGFPGILKNCETCHVAGSYDFSASASSSALANRLYRTVATGSFNASSSALTAFQLSPYVDTTGATNYGSGFSFSATTGATTAAAGTTLVNSPIAGACFACHDSDLAKQHMEANGGSLYAARTAALAKSEQCMLCHASGKVADIKVMHAK